MIRVMFVCLGNICRSPMAEFILKDMVKKIGLEKDFFIASSATSSEEIGNAVHSGTRRVLEGLNIDCSQKRAVKLKKSDYDKYDYILAMERANIKNILRIIGEDSKGKVKRLLDFSQKPRDIADPWYTGNFDSTYIDICEGCNAFLKYVTEYKN